MNKAISCKKYFVVLFTLIISIFILSSCSYQLDSQTENNIINYMKKQGVIDNNWKYVGEWTNYEKDGDNDKYISSDLVYKDKKANKYYSLRVYDVILKDNKDYYKVEFLSDCTVSIDDKTLKSYKESKVFWFTYIFEDCTDTINEDLILQGDS